MIRTIEGKTNFTARYVFALSLIAALSIMAYINLSALIHKQSDDSAIINISGKQRMLSQQIALYAIYYKTKPLTKNLTMMQQAHDYLLSKEMSEEMRALYFDAPVNLDERVRLYIDHGEQFFKNRNGKSLTYILEHSQSLLKYLDMVVNQYQREAENRIYKLSKNESFIIMMTLLILLIEALFIFRPLNHRINEKQKALQKGIDYSNAITESNTNAIIVLNSDFKVSTFNKRAEKIFGFSKEEMLDKNRLQQIIPKRYVRLHEKEMKRFFNKGTLRYKNRSMEFEGQRKSGEIFPIRISFGINEDIHNRFIVATIQDISTEKLKDKQMLVQSRYAAMGEMIENIAHQWRQPLSAVCTLSSGARLKKEANIISDQELYQTFDNITKQTQYLSQTINDFSSFFETNERQEIFSFDDCITHALDLTKLLLDDYNIKVFFKHSTQERFIYGKKGELSQVIMNLLYNAKDIFVEKELDEKIILVKLSNKEKYGYIEIFDNAGGVPPKILPKVFEPYFTTKHKLHGTGIGLFMSKEIIEKHYEGELKVNNRHFTLNGKDYFGAHFIIKIPIQ